MPHSGPPCQPPVFDHGFDRQEHDAQANSFYWTVFIGRVPGIYLDLDEAQAQTHKCSNMKWRRFSTYDEARTFWDECCLKLHTHEPHQYKVKGVKGIFDSYDEALAVAATQFITQA